MKYYKVEDVINTLADQWRFEQEIASPYQPADIEEWKKVARELYADLPTIEVSEDNRIDNLLEQADNLIAFEKDLLADCEEVPSEDCISRADLKKSLTRPLENNNANEMYWRGWHDCTVAVETRIADAPKVMPGKIEGEWSITINEDYRCSVCGLITSTYKANYCPNCGAKMEGTDDE